MFRVLVAFVVTRNSHRKTSASAINQKFSGFRPTLSGNLHRALDKTSYGHYYAVPSSLSNSYGSSSVNQEMNKQPARKNRSMIIMFSIYFPPR